jgi:hypothetical protein
MRSQWKRLVWAALLSCAGFAATFLWYTLTKSTHGVNADEKPLAFVGKAVDDIQRRPATRQLWQPVETGDPLYNGEAIRTSDKGEVRIQFADSNRYLDLEPESLIVIQQSKGEISLDLMEGNLYVAAAKESDGTPSASLVLNSAAGKVDLTKASANLSRSAGKQVDVQVLQGTASLTDKNGKAKSLRAGDAGPLAGGAKNGFDKSTLKILSPMLGKVAFVDTEDNESLTFKWSGFPKDVKVSVWAGATRKALKEIAHARAVDAETLHATLPVGKSFWKLVAKNPKTGEIVAESSEYRTEIQPRYAPTVVFPLSNAKIPTPAGTFDMAFKWQKGEETNHVVLEVAKDPGLKEKIATKNFTNEDTFTVPALPPGDYFWRMSSYYEGSDRPLLGKVQKFSLTKIEEKPAPPKEPVEVTWTVPEDKIQFYLDQPKLNLTWNSAHAEDVTKWRVSYFEENEDPANVQTVDLKADQKDAKAETILKKPGRYIASVEGLNRDGEVLITTPRRKIAVAPLPLLPPPQILPLDGILSAAADGRTELNWQKVDGAKEYKLTISTAQGKPLKTLKYTGTQTALKNLMPGEYQLSLSAVDEHGRSSESSPLRKLTVPDKSNLKAPTLKKIKVN